MAKNLVCEKCGKVLSGNASFCTACGEKVTSSNKEETNLGSSNDFTNIRFKPKENIHRPKKISRTIPYNELKTILKDFERRSGERYENAKNRLLENIPLEAVQPLFRLSRKVTLDTQKRIDAIEILGAIGTDEVVNLLMNERFFDDDIKFHVVKEIASIGSPLSTTWLIENSFDFPENVLAYAYLEDVLPKERIFDLAAKGINLEFYEVDNGLVSRKIGFAIIESIAKNAAKQEKKKRELSILPFTKALPIPIVIALSQICHKSYALYMRMVLIYQMCEKFGFQVLNDWEIYKATHNSKEISPYSELLIASIYVLKKKDHPMVYSALSKTIKSPTAGNASYIAKMFAFDFMVTHSNNFRNPELDQILINGIINDNMFTNSIISSVFLSSADHLYIHVFNKLNHIKRSALKNLMVPIIFGKCRGIPECIPYYESLRRSANSSLKESIDLFENMFSEIA